MKQVAIYIRVSTEEQVNHWNGLDIQREALLNYVKLQGFKLDDKHIFVDEWRSGAEKENRPALESLFESAQKKEFDIVLVWKVDRFFRKSLYLLEWIEALENMGIGFTSITQPFDTTQAFWKMSLQMMWSIAELERELIKERTFNGILSTMKKWKWWRGNTPYWYRKDTEWFLIIEEEEAKIIQMIYRMLVKDGLTTSQIVKKLNDMKVETYWSKWWLGKWRKTKIKHSNLWRKSTIQKILHNEIYIWKLVQNKYRVLKWKRTLKNESEWIIWKSPKIVSKSLYNSAQRILTDNQKFSLRSTKKKNVYMLAKLIECSVTGYKYTWYVATKGTKNYRINVNRSKVSNFDDIGSRWVSANIIDTAVWNQIKQVLSHPQILEKELSNIWNLSDEKTKGIKQEILLLNESLKKIEDNSNGLLEMVSSMDKDSIEMVQTKLRANQNKVKGIKEEKSILEQKLGDTTMVSAKIQDISYISKIVKGNLDNLGYKAKAEICRLLIKKVKFDGENAEIELIVPINPMNKIKQEKNYAKEFFDKSDKFLSKKIMEVTDDFKTWVEVLSKLRTYYHQMIFRHFSVLKSLIYKRQLRGSNTPIFIYRNSLRKYTF